MPVSVLEVLKHQDTTSKCIWWRFDYQTSSWLVLTLSLLSLIWEAHNASVSLGRNRSSHGCFCHSSEKYFGIRVVNLRNVSLFSSKTKNNLWTDTSMQPYESTKGLPCLEHAIICFNHFEIPEATMNFYREFSSYHFETQGLCSE